MGEDKCSSITESREKQTVFNIIFVLFLFLGKYETPFNAIDVPSSASDATQK